MREGKRGRETERERDREREGGGGGGGLLHVHPQHCFDCQLIKT